MKKPEQFATIILMVPSYDPTLKHTGGILRVWDGNGALHEFDSSKITEVTVVAFDPHLEHECTPITEGTRLIFKTTWCYDSNAHSLMSAFAKELVNDGEPGDANDRAADKLEEIKSSLVFELDRLIDYLRDDDSEVTTSRLESEYTDLKKILAQMKNIEEQVVHSNTRYDLKQIFARLDKCKASGLPFVIVPLFNFYEEIRHGHLYYSDHTLADALRQRYGRVGLKQLMSSRHESADDMSPLSDSENPPDFEEVREFTGREDDYNPVKQIAEFINTRDCAAGSRYQDIGRTLQHSEYNDSTYDRNYHNLYTCIIVWF